MPNVVNLSDVIRETISHAAMMSKRAKVNAELSAYDPYPMSLDCVQENRKLGESEAGQFVKSSNHE